MSGRRGTAPIDAGLTLHPVAELFPPMPDLDLVALREDIRAHGVRLPILVYRGQILDGRHRYECCRDLGIECPQIEWNGADPWLDAQSLNLRRRHLSQDSVDAIHRLAAKRFPEVAKTAAKARAEAAERQQAGKGVDGSGGRGKKKTLPSRDGKVLARQPTAASTVGAMRGVSGATVERVGRVEREAPEQLEAIAAGRKSAVQVLREVNREKLRAIQAHRAAMPSGRYQCVVIDPPWIMQKIERDVRPNQEGFDYPTMSADELRALPLPELAENDCHLYLWTTHKHLPLALHLADHWGFAYQCLMTWVKNVGFTPFSWMYSTEHVLFARRGNLELLTLGLRLDFNAPVQEHSRKPAVFYDLVRRASPGPRLDMFSRELHEGFDQYGNQPDHFAKAAD